MAHHNLHTLNIDKLVPGGLGLGRLAGGMVVLVPGVLPGERVLVREVRRKKDFIQGSLTEILSASPDRITPPCPVYGRCGGCDLQHAAPEAQLRLKKAMLAESLQRTESRIFHDVSATIAAPIGAPAQFHYRQRLRLQVNRRGDFGFFKVESHDIIPVSQCPLAGVQLNEVLRQLHTSGPFYRLLQHASSFELLFHPDANNVIMLLHYQRKPRPADSEFSQDLLDHIDGLVSVYMMVESHGLYDPVAKAFPGTPPILTYTTEIKALGSPLTFTWEAGAFCQVNLEQNSRLVDIVLEMIGPGRCKKILDLYCGYGNFSLPAASLAEQVLGIDSQNGAIRSGIRNVGINGILNCRFEKKLVPEAVADLLAASIQYDTIILDPPRRGAPEIAALMPQLQPEKIIYISCNPATLARDLASLAAAGYRLVRLVPVDMFPQTHHLESVALLKR